LTGVPAGVPVSGVPACLLEFLWSSGVPVEFLLEFQQGDEPHNGVFPALVPQEFQQEFHGVPGVPGVPEFQQEFQEFLSQ
jgi:hypothetical protein